MERPVGFEEEGAAAPGSAAPEELPPAQSVLNFRTVPWLSWDEWDHVRFSLFSSSPDAIEAALIRISTWRSRGCIPPLIEVTADFVVGQQMDPFFRKDQDQAAPSGLDQILANLYSMAVMRLVNAVVEKTRKKRETSIAEAAEEYDIPRMLIDVRHDCSHRELPALPLLREASLQALDWLKSYYWDPQKHALPSPVRGTREKIDSKLRDLALRRCSLSGHRKKSRAILNDLVLLYNSFSSEVVSSLLGLLLKVLPSFIDDPHQERPRDLIRQSSLSEWGTLITQFSTAAPDLLLNLLQEILDKIGSQEATRYETGIDLLSSPENTGEDTEIDRLCYLFSWVVGRLKEVNAPRSKSSPGTEAPPTEKDMSRGILLEILRRLLVSAAWNKQLMDSAVELAQLIRETSLVDKVQKFHSLACSNLDFSDKIPPVQSSSDLFKEQEESLHLASQKLELVGFNYTEDKVISEVATSGRWRVTKSWSSCPIGMLPFDTSSSSRLPTLSCDAEGRPVMVEWNFNELDLCTRKRETSPLGDSMDSPSSPGERPTYQSTKKIRVTEEEGSEAEGTLGCLAMNGAWKHVNLEDLRAIKSTVQIML
ncbi:uncharacterized protein LOC116211645 [Punica granatum]|uniref:Uncharacterized protein LOC116211645 n=2 Tax=Punica granatum TaxID=22663 RepID=A0A6P8DWV3_PUNGR|nr:uncharacterized protein LOC116211645 [Punica granatum]